MKTCERIGGYLTTIEDRYSKNYTFDWIILAFYKIVENSLEEKKKKSETRSKGCLSWRKVLNKHSMSFLMKYMLWLCFPVFWKKRPQLLLFHKEQLFNVAQLPMLSELVPLIFSPVRYFLERINLKETLFFPVLCSLGCWETAKGKLGLISISLISFQVWASLPDQLCWSELWEVLLDWSLQHRRTRDLQVGDWWRRFLHKLELSNAWYSFACAVSVVCV